MDGCLVQNTFSEVRYYLNINKYLWAKHAITGKAVPVVD